MIKEFTFLLAMGRSVSECDGEARKRDVGVGLREGRSLSLASRSHKPIILHFLSHTLCCFNVSSREL